MWVPAPGLRPARDRSRGGDRESSGKTSTTGTGIRAAERADQGDNTRVVPRSVGRRDVGTQGPPGSMVVHRVIHNVIEY
jgi:hypothetical protein